jgi:hypothetical protein
MKNFVRCAVMCHSIFLLAAMQVNQYTHATIYKTPPAIKTSKMKSLLPRYLRDIRAPINKCTRSIPDKHSRRALISLALRRKNKIICGGTRKIRLN